MLGRNVRTDRKGHDVFRGRSRLGVILVLAAIIAVLAVAAFVTAAWWQYAVIQELVSVDGGVSTNWSAGSWVRHWLNAERSRAFERINGLSLDDPRAVSVVLRNRWLFRYLESLDVSCPVNEDDLAQLVSLGPIKDLVVRPATDELLAPVGKMAHLEALAVYDSVVGDDGLAHLSNLTDLRELNLRRTKVSDHGITALSKMARLVRLDLSGTRIDGSGLAYLQNLDELKELDLSGTNVNDSGLIHLVNLGSLRKLDVSGTQITDKGLMGISELKGLTELHLAGTRITDAGMEHVVKLPDLQELSIADTAITDRGLMRLVACKKLSMLKISVESYADWMNVTSPRNKGAAPTNVSPASLGITGTGVEAFNEAHSQSVNIQPTSWPL